MSSSAERATDFGGVRVLLGSPEIWRAQFSRNEEPGSGDDRPSDLVYSLGVSRLAESEVQVEIGARARSPQYDFDVAYRIGIMLEVTAEQAQEIDIEHHLRMAAARIAPMAVFPFIRELISSFTLRAGLEPVMLPVTNMGVIFKPEAVEIPAFVPEEDSSNAADSTGAIESEGA